MSKLSRLTGLDETQCEALEWLRDEKNSLDMGRSHDIYGAIDAVLDSWFGDGWSEWDKENSNDD